MKDLAEGIEVKVKIAEYTLDRGKYVIDENKIYFLGNLNNKVGEWLQCELSSLVTRSYNELITARVGIFFEVPVNTEVYFENV
jgi:hypothetical protein